MFIHLRARSDYSLLESSITIEKLIFLCVKNNMPAMALTDNGNLFGSLEFAECAAAAGVQPIIGCNLILYDADNFFPVVLLVKNNQGYINLVHLVTRSFKHRVDHIKCIVVEDLLCRSDGLILLTGKKDGILSELFALNRLDSMLAAFKDNIFVELQRCDEIDELLEERLINFAYTRKLPLVATNDVFFATPDDFEASDALSCIANGTYVLQEDRKKILADHYFKSSKEMLELFSDIPEAVANTILIAKKCSFRPEAREPILPHFPCSYGKTEAEELRIQAIAGLEQRILTFSVEMKDQYYKRLEYELGVIISMNYSGYFLIVSDFIRWSKKNNVPVGPGRGSGAGSLVAWSLDITDLNPIKFGLIFERFLNPERVSMPDFDIDFCQDKREKVIEYVQEKYGYVAQIITFGKLQARAVLRDVGRVLQMPYSQIDRICKMIPHNPVNPVTLFEAIQMDASLQKERDNDQNIRKLLSIALKLEGLHRHTSTHAAGIVICDRPLEELIPTCYEPGSSLPITQYNMKYTEKAGLVKFDFLGLKTLTLIDQICVLINQDSAEKVDIYTIPLDDKKTYEMLSKKDSVGIFQLESSGMQEAIHKLKPDNIEDIIALISLYRPGPMDNISTYIRRKHGLEQVDYIDPMLEVVLKETFGVIIYQEQVMEIAKIMAGYSLGSADLLRRAMGKKIKKEMDKQRETFIVGAVKNGVSAEKASYVFDLVAKFAGYGFNKSHAAAYAMISFQTAYLKANYPLAFFTALLNLDLNDKDKLSLFCHTIKAHGIEILPPDIYKSDAYFSIEGTAIRYGLGALKNVGLVAVRDIIRGRTTRYNDIWEFINRLDGKLLNRKSLESLIKSGAFDSLNVNRRQLCESIDIFISIIDENRKNSLQTALFSPASLTELSMIDIEDWSSDEKLKEEFCALGFYLTGHPLAKHEGILEKLGIGFINSDVKVAVSKIAGIILNVNIRSSNRGKFAIIALSCPYSIAEIAFYNEQIIANSNHLFVSGAPVMIELDKSGQQIRLVGKQIYDLYEITSSLINKLVITIYTSSYIDQLSVLLNRGGKTKVFLILLGEEIKLELPELYRIDLATIITIMGYNWVADVMFV